MITIKLTYTPIKVAQTITVKKKNATIADMVAACKAHWPKVVARVEDETKAGSTYAMPFAEVYAPEYSDELSGDLSIALDGTVKPKAKAVPPKPLAKVVIPASKATRPSKMRPATASSRAHKTKVSKVSKAEMVRELIRSNPKKDVDALIVMAIDELEMTQGKAKVYVTENVPRVRG